MKIEFVLRDLSIKYMHIYGIWKHGDINAITYSKFIKYNKHFYVI